MLQIQSSRGSDHFIFPNQAVGFIHKAEIERKITHERNYAKKVTPATLIGHSEDWKGFA